MKKILVITAGLGLAIALGSATAQSKHSFWMKGAVIDVQGKTVIVCLGEPGAAKVGQKLFVSRVSSAVGGKNSVKRTKIGAIKVTEIFEEHMARGEVVSGTIKYGDLVALDQED